MLKYIGRRLLSTLISVSFILAIGFLIIQLQPYDPATIYLAQLRQQGADVDERAIQVLYGLKKPAAVQYWEYLTRGNRVQSRPPAAPTPIPYQPPSTGGQNPVNDQPYDAMFFKSAGVNPFIDTEDDHLSTFAMDVDTTSYTMARRYVNDGYLPPQEAVRVEEFINYFDLAYPGPQNGDAFAVHLEGAPSPFGDAGYYLLKIGIQGLRVRDDQRKDAVLTFVIDTSGSMGMENRLHLVKQALLLLVSALRPTDRVGIVAYGSDAYTVLETTYASDKLAILDAIDTLQADGSTYAEEGLRQGYEMANRAFDQNATNRIILCSDGVANVGQTGADGILAVIADYAQRGITRSAVGFGMGNYN